MSHQYGGPPQQPYPPYGAYPPPPPRKRRRGLFWLAVIGLPFLLLVGCTAVVVSVANTAQTTPRSALPQAQASEEDSAASTEPAAETPAPTPPPQPKPKMYKGFGSKVLKIKPTEKPGMATITHQGASNFAVKTVTAEGEEQDLLVNEIGNYKGTVIYNVDAGTQTSAFKIEADGAWTVLLRPITLARSWSGDRLTGRGHDVVRVDPPITGLVSVRVRHAGTSNFAVYAYHGDNDEKELLINEIGHYNGEVLMPDDTFLLVVEADGAWTMQKT
ncbi:hypothetical protein AB0O34_35555 [Sphaerisporangium sp. NPDC088356]|uniref:hypothetical protein n=1 Tax=Sphaerisporangium sp. NPDC088356 TaxID=3154871 RepID=UPI003446660F